MNEYQAEVRKALINLAMSIQGKMEGLSEDITVTHEEDPVLITEFDKKRTLLSLQVAVKCMEDLTEQLKQVGYWEEVRKDPEQSWLNVKKKFKL